MDRPRPSDARHDAPAPGAATPSPADARHVATRPAAPLVIGVLGGIASGKSAVARVLAGPRGALVDADRIAHEVLESAPVRAWLMEQVGPAAFAGQLVDRAALGRRVFADAALRRGLEAAVHPQVRVRIREALREAREHGAERVILDVPLLLENEAQHGLTAECDALVFVETDARVRAERALHARGWTGDELARREAAQMPLELKRARADVVIENDGDLARLAERAAAALREIERRAAAR